MKTKTIILTGLMILLTPATIAADKHDHDHDHSKCSVEVGPQGGRIIEKNGQRAEFFVTKEGKATVTLINKKDTKSKAENVLLLIKGKPIKLKSQGAVYTSPVIKDKFPAKVHVAFVISGKKVIETFTVDLAKCGECKNVEYACTCHNHDH